MALGILILHNSQDISRIYLKKVTSYKAPRALGTKKYSIYRVTRVAHVPWPARTGS